MIKKFRKKPVVIEAMQWCGNNFQELEEFGSQRHIISNPDGTLTIKTLEGNHTAQKNDWIIRGVQGEVYPCKPDIFEATYEDDSIPEVRIYTMPTCPWCKKTKEFFKENRIKYEEINVAGDYESAHEMIEKSGQMGVPVTEIVREIIVGYDVKKLKKALKL